MTKKRKIRVPAASNGSKVDNPLQEQESGSKISDMLPDILQGADLLLNPLMTSTASTGREALGQSLANVGKGAAVGAQVAGLPGAIGGAVIGAIGSRGREADMTSFTDYDEGTLGTGLIGAFSNRRLRRQRERIKRNAYSNRDAVRGTEYLANNFETQYGDMDSNTFANGGSTNSLAYVDDGELISTPTGIKEVPEQGKPTDSNLVSLPAGSKILSDRLKVPGSNETFAERGKKIMKRKKSLYKDQLAQNAAELNAMNEQAAFDELFNQQEALKKKRGIKPKSKNLPAYVNGGPEEKGIARIGNTYYNLGDTVDYNGGKYIVTGRNEFTPEGDSNIQSRINNYRNSITRSGTIGVGDNEPRVRHRTTTSFPYGSNTYRTIGTNAAVPTEGIEWMDLPTITIPKPPAIPNQTRTVEGGELDQVTVTAPRNRRTTNRPKTTVPTPPSVEQVWLQDTPPTVDLVMEDIDDTVPDVEPTITGKGNDDNYRTPDPLRHRTNWLALAPVLSNLFTARPEKVDAVYNPYANSIMRTMGGRRYDIRPVINDINRNRAVSNYNASQVNTNTGANMAYMLASQANANNAISAARSAESNVNNSYLADYANVANNLGQQWVNATNLAADANARNRATARNIRRTGLSQLSQWGQTELLNRNQVDRDNAFLQLYDPMLRNFTPETYNNFYNFLSRM